MDQNTSNTGIIITIVVIILIIIGAVFMLRQSDSDILNNTQTPGSTTSGNNSMMAAPQEDGVMVGGSMMVRSRDIVDNAATANNVTTLVTAVNAAGLVDTLKGDGPFTVFAPNNAAFAKLPAGTVETLLRPENKAMLTNILTYHVVAGRYTSADLKDGQLLKTVQGETIRISKTAAGKITVNGSAVVETPDVISSNGVTFVIDSVLMPSTK